MTILRGSALIARLLLVFAIAAIFVSTARAVSLAPDIVEKLRKEGRLQDYIDIMKQARARGVDMPATGKSAYHLTLGADGARDTLHLAVILVDFSDNQWQDGPDGTQQYFQDLLFSQGVMQTPSMAEYYLENSYGNLLIEGDVYGWYRMPQLYSYYVGSNHGLGSYPQNAQKLVQDALLAADDDVDYSLYDRDEDGWMDRDLIVVHAGQGAETSTNPNLIWSHKWFLGSHAVKLDNVWISGYTMQPEQSNSSSLSTIGVFCHEFGHALGLPDLYDTDYSSEGLGNWSVMASGSYNGGGRTPSCFDAWCKIKLGFVNPVEITANEVGHVFPAIEEDPQVALIRDSKEEYRYFLIENRQRVGTDVSLPGTGLLIFSVNDSKSGNTDEQDYLVGLRQADGLLQLENNSNRGDSGDPFPGSTDNREFSDRTTPSSRSNQGFVTEIAVWDISDNDSVMTANLDVTWSRPLYSLQSMTFDDAPGNNNGVLDLGETVDVYFQIQNFWAAADGAVATLTADDPRIDITAPTVNLGEVEGDSAMVDNESSPFTFVIPQDMDTTQVSFTLTLTDNSAGGPAIFEVKENVGGARVLIVDDDNSNPGHYEHYYTDALDSIGYTYTVWGKDTLGAPGVDQYRYPMIIWFTGDTRSSTLTAEDREFLRNYIDFGGGLFLTGQDIAQHLATTDPQFLTDYLHCSYGGSLTAQFTIFGVPGSQTGDYDSLVVTDNDGAQNLSSADFVLPDDEADVCFRYSDGQDAGLELQDGYSRIVLFGFGFEAISDYFAAFGFGTREKTMGRIVNYLDARPAAPNRPPAAFSLVSPADGDTIETESTTLAWDPSVDIDVGDWVTYTVYFSDSDTSSWDMTSGIADTEYTVSGLEIDKTYYWRVAALDSRGASRLSSETFSFRSTGDITPPSFTVSWMPNSILPFDLDIYVFSSEALGSMPEVTLTTPSGSNGEDVTKLSGRDAETYFFEYHMTQPGSYSISVCGDDLRGNHDCTDDAIAAAPLMAGSGTYLQSTDRIFRVDLPSDAVKNDGLLMLTSVAVSSDDMSDYGSEQGFEPLYRLKAQSTVGELQSNGSIVIDLSRFGSAWDDGSYPAILRREGNGWIRLQTQYDAQANTLTAHVSEFGTFIFGKSRFAPRSDENPTLPSAYQLRQNWPNPFNMETSIAFDLSAPARTKLVIYNILGQRVTTLLDRYLDAGSHTVSWNGLTDSGSEVSSGIYFYRLESGSFTQTKRMLLVK